MQVLMEDVRLKNDLVLKHGLSIEEVREKNNTWGQFVRQADGTHRMKYYMRPVLGADIS